MKKILLFVFLSAIATGIHSQKAQKKSADKWRITELDSLAMAKEMFDDQNFIMAIPFITTIQMNHPDEPFLKYISGICCIFEPTTQEKALQLLLLVYEDNKKAEDIEFYLALAYHYNNDFANGQIMSEKFLSHKHLSNPQRRAGEKIKDHCIRGEMLPIPADEGKLEDYMATYEVVMEESK